MERFGDDQPSGEKSSNTGRLAPNQVNVCPDTYNNNVNESSGFNQGYNRISPDIFGEDYEDPFEYQNDVLLAPAELLPPSNSDIEAAEEMVTGLPIA